MNSECISVVNMNSDYISCLVVTKVELTVMKQLGDLFIPFIYYMFQLVSVNAVG